MPDRNKLVVVLKGGLGNQLFTYAAARRLAAVNSAELVVDNISGFKQDFEYQRQYALNNFNIAARIATRAERLEPLSNIRRRAIRRWSRREDFQHRRYIEQEFRSFDARLLDLRFTGTRYIEGYWQSEKYFLDIAPDIRDDLRITSKMDARDQQLSQQIQDRNSIAVHVRWFEVATDDQSSNAPQQYYQRSLVHMESTHQDPHYFLFSDRPNDAALFINYPSDRLTVIDHGKSAHAPIVDLQLMSQCKHIIMANSTFSWWGAWLGDTPDRSVVSPKLGLDGIGAWGFDGLIPDRWLQI